MSYDDCYCDYDPAEVYVATLPKARKQHRCYECDGPIVKGERYERVFGVWNGSADCFKTCERCVDLRTWVKNNVPCTCWAHGNLHDDLSETVQSAWRRAREETRGLWFGFLRRKVAISKFNERRIAS